MEKETAVGPTVPQAIDAVTAMRNDPNMPMKLVGLFIGLRTLEAEVREADAAVDEKEAALEKTEAELDALDLPPVHQLADLAKIQLKELKDLELNAAAKRETLAQRTREIDQLIADPVIASRLQIAAPRY